MVDPTERLLAHLTLVERLMRLKPARPSARARLGARLGWKLVHLLLSARD